jgi:alpha-1,3-glucosyltransferase
MLPFCILLFKMGKNNIKSLTNDINCTLHLQSLLWGAAGSSLSFFLASFQVHEKSILLPLAPLSLLVCTTCTTSLSIHWFSIVSIWSMWHLLVVDRLQIPYFAIIVIYLCYVYLYLIDKNIYSCTGGTSTTTTTSSKTHDKNFWLQWDKRIYDFLSNLIIPISAVSMIGLHVLEVCIDPPTTLPDLFPVLWVIVSCGSFCIMWLLSLWKLFLVYSAACVVEEGDEISSIHLKED